MLQLINVTKDYVVGDTVVNALKGVSLTFRNSDFVSILGPSGCGKTTMLNIIGGLDHYTTGDLVIDGVSTKHFKDSDWDAYRNAKIGFVFQSYNLIPHITVLDNVELALTISGMGKSERIRRAKDALASVGLSDQLKKMPRQLSGGQLQRVAIARALVNDPEILLADEPTGALDSVTSVQVMELLKEISNDRLVIMVTHNRELADEYSTRIISLHDGKVVNDTRPLNTEERSEADSLRGNSGYITSKTAGKGGKRHKTSMSFLTAISLSFRNLLTKKGRTILTAFAGSIGIIGVALIMALSSGLNAYIAMLQRDTLSRYPLTVSSASVDFDSFMGSRMQDELEQVPGEININRVMEGLKNVVSNKTITENYLKNTIDTIDPSLIYGTVYSYELSLNVYAQMDVPASALTRTVFRNVSRGGGGASSFVSSLAGGGTFSELVNNENYLRSQYEVVATADGYPSDYLPKEADELAIVVSDDGTLTDYALMSIGIIPEEGQERISYEDIFGHTLYCLTNDGYYKKDRQLFSTTFSVKEDENGMIYESSYMDKNALALKIVSIIKLTKEASTGSVASTLGYTKALTDYIMMADAGYDTATRVQDISKASEIVRYQKEHPRYNAFTGKRFGADFNDDTTYDDVMSEIGGNASLIGINIYPVDFEAKERVKTHINEANKKLSEDERVEYTDIMAIVISSVTTLIDSISTVLIAFTAVSLVVSSIMIGIITYISVLERTKEIGIIRSIGGRKRDISRIFNAETLIIGFAAGMFGVIITLLLSIPINIILFNLTEIANLAALPFVGGVFLILLSMCLTLIAGIIPSRVAAKKDPVIALRTE